jgi:hypothetical protein
MPAIKGRQNYLAVKTEATRLTAETTSFTRWVPWKTWESKNEVGYEIDDSAYDNRGALLDKQVATQYGVWTVGGKLDVDQVDFFLHHLIGSSTPTTALGATTRVYTLLQSLQLPTFTTQFERGDETFKKLTGCSVASGEINIGVDDSNYSFSGHAVKEDAGNSLTPAYATPSRKLMGKDVTMYFATTLGGLGSVTSPTGTQFKVKSAKWKVESGVDATRYFETGSINPTDITADGYKMSLELEVIHATANAAVTFQTNFDAGTPMAIRMHALSASSPVIGTSTLKPTLSVALPPSKITLGNAIPLDDLITQTITIDVERPDLAVVTTINVNATI